MEKADQLPAQTDISQPLDGPDWVRLQSSDLAAYNALYPRYNANIAWASEHCVARPAPGR